jgi:hypothetical protein
VILKQLARPRFPLAVPSGLLLLMALPSAIRLEETSTIRIGNAKIHIELDAGDWGSARAKIPPWVRSAGESVAAYYGRYPLDEVALRLSPFEGEGLRHGMTFGSHGGYITIHVGNNTTESDFENDWMLTHEMVHLSFPSVDENHHWIEEGIATYVEPIARVQAGHLEVKEMWFELVRDLPQGLPGPDDQGLDRTHTWADTYWGGALYCFLADIEIRQATQNRKGLQDALRGILNAGGDIRKSWDMEKTLTAGDEATGVSVLVPLYEKVKDQPIQANLPEMWRELGITRTGNTVVFDDKAPMASLREAITTKPT